MGRYAARDLQPGDAVHLDSRLSGAKAGDLRQVAGVRRGPGMGAITITLDSGRSFVVGGSRLFTVTNRGRGRGKPRGEYNALGRVVKFKPGQKHTITVGYSEAAMHLGMAGKTVPVQLSRTGRSAQLFDERGREVSFPITAGEAGIMHNASDGYYGYRTEPGIEMAHAIRRMGDIARRAESDREWERRYGAARRKPATRSASSHAAKPHRHVHARAR